MKKEVEDKINIELEKLEQNSEELLKNIDMNNMSDEDVEKVQGTIEEMFKKIQDILQESNKLDDDQEEEIDLDLE